MKDLLLHGDVFACLDYLENNSVKIAITSPPYWQQRDYGYASQIGQEKTPEDFIGHLKVIFDKLKEKLHNDGVFFLNIGDKYYSQYGKSHLLLIPYRLAFHMVKSGWILKDIIIWHKLNHMPSSVKDRFSNTYEPVFVFVKSKSNIYKKDLGNVMKVSLQQTKWKHTAVFPEKLIESLLNRIELHDRDLILDPFAGTGTVAKVVKSRRMQLLGKKIHSILIDKSVEYINIIKKRIGSKNVKKIQEVDYEWEPIKNLSLPRVQSNTKFNCEYGEVLIAENSKEFLSFLKGIFTKEFQSNYREDALFFFGVKNWTIKDFYYFSRIYDLGYVARNILVFSNGKTWFPIFMFAKDSTRFAYRFYIDRIRIKSKFKEKIDWRIHKFLGVKVNDVSGKKSKDGIISKIIDRYEDGFPKYVLVRWNGTTTSEFVLHPDNDVFIQEGLIFKCPNCEKEISEPYDLINKNLCSNCRFEIWKDINSLPIVEEPKIIMDNFEELGQIRYSAEKSTNIFKVEKKRPTNSKFKDLKRINWGQSPGARKLMLGDYFTKMRLYRLAHPLVANYLTILRKSKNLTIKNVSDEFPEKYKHTVGHWFRKDFGGSVPIPKDIQKLKKILEADTNLLYALERTILKLQTVRTSKKGKNPGDFYESLNELQINRYLKKLYMPSFHENCINKYIL